MSKNSYFEFTTKPSNPTSNHHRTGETRRSKLCTRAGNQPHYRTTDPSVRSPSCKNSLASSSPSDNNPHWTPTSPLTEQASDRAAPRQTTFSRSSNNDREPSSGTSHCASQPSTSKKAVDTVEHSSVGKASREQGIEEPYIHTITYKVLRPATSSSAHRRQKQILPPRARNQAGRSAHHALVQHTPAVHMKPLTGKWKRDNHGVKLAEHDPNTNLSSLGFADDILLISGSLQHTTTMQKTTLPQP